MKVRSSSHCAIEHVSALFAATLQRLDGGEDAPPPEERLRIAMLLLHRSTFDTYHKWVKQMATPKISATRRNAAPARAVVPHLGRGGQRAPHARVPSSLACDVQLARPHAVEAEDPVEQGWALRSSRSRRGGRAARAVQERSFKPSSDGPSTVGGLPRKLRMPQFVESALSRRLPRCHPRRPPRSERRRRRRPSRSASPKKPALPKMGSSSANWAIRPGLPQQDYHAALLRARVAGRAAAKKGLGHRRLPTDQCTTISTSSSGSARMSTASRGGGACCNGQAKATRRCAIARAGRRTVHALP